ncbi:MAG: hypothetical protein ACHQD8_04125 [Chitinophagales bacterium]
MKKILLILLAGSLLTFNSCTKTGPQGPMGATGATGATGSQGPQGNANVLGSAPFTPNPWTYSSTNHLYYVDYTDQDITTSVVDKGIVEIFKSYGTNDWTNLPDISGITSTVFDFYDGGFSIYVQNSDGSTPASPSGTMFRVVVISPSNRMAHPNTNWKNYNEAMAALQADKAPSAVQ